MIMFRVGDTDFSNRVIAGSYNVISEDVGNTWTDANYVEHIDVVRTRVQGSFDMYFKNMTEYDTFLETLKANKESGHYRITVSCNNLPTNESQKSIAATINFAPSRNRNDFWEDYMERFTVTIGEL